MVSLNPNSSRSAIKREKIYHGKTKFNNRINLQWNSLYKLIHKYITFFPKNRIAWMNVFLSICEDTLHEDETSLRTAKAMVTQAHYWHRCWACITDQEYLRVLSSIIESALFESGSECVLCFNIWPKYYSHTTSFSALKRWQQTDLTNVNRI